MNKQPNILNRLKLLLTRFPSLTPKDQLGTKLPVKRNIPSLLDLAINNRIVVLEVCAKAFGFEGDPEGELMHGGGVLGPVGEVVGVEGEGFLEGLDGFGVFEEEDLQAL